MKKHIYATCFPIWNFFFRVYFIPGHLSIWVSGVIYGMLWLVWQMYVNRTQSNWPIQWPSFFVTLSLSLIVHFCLFPLTTGQLSGSIWPLFGWKGRMNWMNEWIERKAKGKNDFVLFLGWHTLAVYRFLYLDGCFVVVLFHSIHFLWMWHLFIIH